MKIFGIIAKILFISAVPLFLFSFSIGVVVNSKWFYNNGFEKYNISQVTGISLSDLDKAAAGLIDYFNNGEEYIDVNLIKDGQPYKLYSEDEKQIIHLKDVKTLFRLDYKVLTGSFVFILTFVVVLLWKKCYRSLGYGMAWGGGLTLLLMVAMGVGIMSGFDQLFWNFHLLAFSNDFWLLDPSIDVLIMMFPDGFWLDVVIYVAVLTAVLAVAVGMAGWLIGKTQNSSPRSNNQR